MPKKVKTPAEVNNKIKKRFEKQSLIIGTRRVNKEGNATQVVAMRQRLEENKLLPPTNITDLNLIATESLGALNIIIRDDISRNYSLLGQQKNERLLDNPNIINPNLKNLENDLQDPFIKKFPSKSDPFYELDDGRPQYIKNQDDLLKKQNKKDITKIAADLFDLNSTLKHPKTKKIQQLAKYRQRIK